MSNASTEYRSRTSWSRALWLTLWLRLAYSALAAAFVLIQPVNWRLVRSNALTENLPPPDHSVRYLSLGLWERFDSLWYLHLAAHGYDRPDAVVFFPLYPLLIKILGLLVSPIAAALLISTVAPFFLFWGLQELLLADHTPDFTNQTIFLCAVWPASFIFFAGYPESLLLALIVWSLCMAARGKWITAAAFGLAAALTKAIGVVVVVPLLIMALRRRRAMALPMLLIPLAWVGFMEYLQWTGRGAITSAYVQSWRTLTAPPWTVLSVSIRALIHTPNPILILNFIFLIVGCILAALSKLRTEYLLYAAAALVVFLCKETTPPLQSISRYLLIVFPMFVGAARLFQSPPVRSRFWLACAALFLINIGLLWLFMGWSLVV